MVETGFVVEWRDGTAEVGGNAGVWVTDQEGEVEVLEHLGGNHGGIARFGVGVVRVWRLRLIILFAADVGLTVGLLVSICEPIGVTIGMTIGMTIGVAVG